MKLKHIGEISDWLIEEWGRIYAPLNVEQELLKMEAWLEANPKRRKTKRGYPRFVTGWLAKAHAQVAVAQVNSRMYARAGNYEPARPQPDYSEECDEIKRRYPDLA